MELNQPAQFEYGIVANNRGDTVLRPNARVVVLQIGDARCLVSGLSMGGRRVKRWTALKNLCNFRGSWMGEHGRYDSREQADRVATNLEIS